MNTDKLVPIDFSRNITPFIMGDNYYSPLLDRDDCTMYERDVQMFNRGEFDNCGYFVTSFADRPNAGTQPVGDDVDINTSWNFDKVLPASIVQWRIEEDNQSWKPNHAAMLAKYQAEQQKEEVNFSGNDHEHRCGKECVPVVHIDKDGDLSLNGEKVGVATKEAHHIALQVDALGDVPELNPDTSVSHKDAIKYMNSKIEEINETPIFTQAMANANELPEIGSEYQASTGKFKAMCYGYNQNHKQVCVGRDGDGYLEYHLRGMIKPIDYRTDEEKLRDAMRNILLDSYGENLTTVIMDTISLDIDKLLASDKFTIKLKG